MFLFFRRKSALPLLTLTLFAIVEVHAATLVGKVSNPDGAAISGAQVTIRRGNPEDSWTAMTADGSYTLPALPTGTYTILVQKSGYEDLTEEGLTIRDDGETIQRDSACNRLPRRRWCEASRRSTRTSST